MVLPGFNLVLRLALIAAWFASVSAGLAQERLQIVTTTTDAARGRVGRSDDLLWAIAKRTGAIVQTGHVERFNRAIRAALPYVDRFLPGHNLRSLEELAAVLAGIERRHAA